MASRLALSRTVTFFALHRYWRAEWSEADNRAAFGALADAPGHGHDYQCRVTVSGPLDDSGMVMDLGLLDQILAEEVTAPLGGRHLNEVVPAFASGAQLPTCEALAGYLFSRVAGRLPAGVRLESVLVAEDATLFAECRAE